MKSIRFPSYEKRKMKPSRNYSRRQKILIQAVNNKLIKTEPATEILIL